MNKEARLIEKYMLSEGLAAGRKNKYKLVPSLPKNMEKGASEEDWQEFFKMLNNQFREKAKSRKRDRLLSDKKFINKMKIFFGFRDPTDTDPDVYYDKWGRKKRYDED